MAKVKMTREAYIYNIAQMTNDELAREMESVSSLAYHTQIEHPIWKSKEKLVQAELTKRSLVAVNA